MICKNCNHENNDTNKYCDNCGIEITNTVPSFSSEEILKASYFSNVMDKIIVDKNKDILIDRINKKRKKKIILAFFMMILGISLIIAGMNLSAKSIFSSNKGKRTIMIYMNGSDLESKYLAATKDLDEITDSKIDYNDINILIYTGGTKKWHNENISNNKQGLFEINESGLQLIEEYDNDKMLDYDNLLFLLKYGYENYDTEYYDLILWDHGAGPIYGYGFDEYNKLDTMSIKEIKQALDNSPFMGENKLEIIGFDACLMSSIEIASSLSSYANYMVASQEFEPGSGWDYGFLKEVDRNTSSQEFGKLIIDYFNKYYMSKDYAKGTSLSLLKLNKIDNVIKYTNQLFSKIDDDLVIDFSSISRTRSNSKSYGRIANEEYYYDLVDFNDLLDKLPSKYEEDVSNLKTSLSDLIIYQKTDLVDTNGVSIFFPYENKKDIEKNLETYKELDFSESYSNFVNDFTNKLLGKKISNWNITKNNIISYGEGNVSISLSEEIIKNYSKADYLLFEKTSNGLFIPIFNGTDIEINDNTMSTTIKKKSLIVNDKEGNQMYLTAIEAVKGTDYVSYYIPATISKFDTDTLKIDVIGVYIDFVVDNDHPNGYISNVYPIELNDNLTYSKVKINIKEWDDISLLSYKYNILDESGNYTSNWQNDPEVTTLVLSAKEDINIEFSDLDISKEYYCLFRIKDSQNNSYLSHLVKVNKK